MSPRTCKVLSSCVFVFFDNETILVCLLSISRVARRARALEILISTHESVTHCYSRVVPVSVTFVHTERQKTTASVHRPASAAALELAYSRQRSQLAREASRVREAKSGRNSPAAPASGAAAALRPAAQATAAQSSTAPESNTLAAPTTTAHTAQLPPIGGQGFVTKLRQPTMEAVPALVDAASINAAPAPQAKDVPGPESHTESLHQTNRKSSYGLSRSVEKHGKEIDKVLAEIRQEPFKTYKLRDPASVDLGPRPGHIRQRDRGAGGPGARGSQTRMLHGGRRGRESKYDAYELIEFEHPPPFYFDEPSNKGQYKRERYLRQQLEESVQRADRQNKFLTKLEQLRAEYESSQKHQTFEDDYY